MPTPKDLLDEPLNIHEPNGLLETRGVTVREALMAFVINVRSGPDAAREFFDRAEASKPKES